MWLFTINVQQTVDSKKQKQTDKKHKKLTELVGTSRQKTQRHGAEFPEVSLQRAQG